MAAFGTGMIRYMFAQNADYVKNIDQKPNPITKLLRTNYCVSDYFL